MVQRLMANFSTMGIKMKLKLPFLFYFSFTHVVGRFLVHVDDHMGIGCHCMELMCFKFVFQNEHASFNFLAFNFMYW